MRPMPLPALLLAIMISSLLAQPTHTTITFFVEHEVDRPNDYIALVVDIKA